MKVDSLRYEILKQLRMSPTYGYDLFLIFSNRNLIQKPAELYKILRTMKEAQLLKAEIIDSTHGQKKEILSPTEEGLKYYFERIVESIRISMSLIMDLTFRNLSNVIFRKLPEFGINFSEAEPKSILILLQHMPITQQIQIITTFFEKQKKSTMLYIKTNPVRPNDAVELESLIKSGFPIKILDPNMNLKQKSIDMIMTLGLNIEIKFETILDYRSPESWTHLLKENGTLFMGFVRERERNKPGILIEIFKEYLDELPEEFQDEVFGEFQFFITISSLLKKNVTNDEISKRLSSAFQDVKQVEISNIMDLFIARNPIQMN